MLFLNDVLNKTSEKTKSQKNLQIISNHEGLKQIICSRIIADTVKSTNKKIIFICTTPKECEKWYGFIESFLLHNSHTKTLINMPPSNYWDLSQTKDNQSSRYKRMGALAFLADPKRHPAPT